MMANAGSRPLLPYTSVKDRKMVLVIPAIHESYGRETVSNLNRHLWCYNWVVVCLTMVGVVLANDSPTAATIALSLGITAWVLVFVWQRLVMHRRPRIDWSRQAVQWVWND